MNFRYDFAPTDAPLQALLIQQPAASLAEIRRCAAVFRRMSADHLSLRVGDVVRRQQGPSLK